MHGYIGVCGAFGVTTATLVLLNTAYCTPNRSLIVRRALVASVALQVAALALLLLCGACGSVHRTDLLVGSSAALLSIATMLVVLLLLPECEEAKHVGEYVGGGVVILASLVQLVQSVHLGLVA